MRKVHIAQRDPGCEQPRGGAAHKHAVRVQACMHNTRSCSGACSSNRPSTDVDVNGIAEMWRSSAAHCVKYRLREVQCEAAF